MEQREQRQVYVLKGHATYPFALRTRHDGLLVNMVCRDLYKTGLLMFYSAITYLNTSNSWSSGRSVTLRT